MRVFSLPQDRSTRALIIANLIPLFGVLFLRWSIITILLTYWSETVIIGFYTALKMAKAEAAPAAGTVARIFKSDKTEPAKPNEVTATAILLEPIKSKLKIMKVIAIPFFILHYGGFLLGYFFFIAVFLPALLNIVQTGTAHTLTISLSGIVVSAAGLLFSHGLSYYQNFIKAEEYKKTDFACLMMSPYKRIIVLHITILLGTFAIMFAIMAFALLIAKWNNTDTPYLGSPDTIISVLSSILLSVFIIVKIKMDKKYHLLEHKKYESNQ